jgi:hypothetical protein
MGDFLFYDDYVRFINGLNTCRELITIADLLNGFTQYYIDRNPSLYTTFLDALLNCYPEYDLECNIDVLHEYDENDFQEYKNPKLEFAAQYMYYLADNHFEIELSRTKNLPENNNPYDFEEEAKFLEYSQNEREKKFVDKKLSFNIPEKYKCNIEKALIEINDSIRLSEEDNFPSKLALVVTVDDVNALPTEQNSFQVYCKTNLLVYLLDNIKLTFKGKYDDKIFDKGCNIITALYQIKLNSGNIQVTRSRNEKKPPLKSETVDRICNRYSPANYKCQ